MLCIEAAVILGECIGTAWHPSDGLCNVFQDLDNTKHVVLVNRSGERRFMRRDQVQWRPRSVPAAQGAGHSPALATQSPAAANVVAQPALFELD